MKKAIKYTLIILLIAAGIFFFAKSYDKIYKTIFKEEIPLEPATQILIGAEAEIIPVKVFEAKRTYFKDSLPVLGTIKGFREVNLRFEVPGILESFNFEEGEKVEEGDIIANLSQRDALLKLEYSRIELDKSEKMFNAGAITKPALEQTRLEYESAKSDFEKTNLYAPREGFLGTKYAEEGGYISPTDKVVTFVDIGNVYAEFGIIEKDISKVAIDQKAEVFVDAYPGKNYLGNVEQISPTVEGRSRTLNLKVKLSNPEDALKPGMFARGVIATYEQQDALIVPTTAVKKTEEGYTLYVVHKLEDEELSEESEAEELGLVEVRKAKLKYMAPDYTEISEGLKEGELVAVEVREELQDKAKVEIAEVQEAPF